MNLHFDVLNILLQPPSESIKSNQGFKMKFLTKMEMHPGQESLQSTNTKKIQLTFIISSNLNQLKHELFNNFFVTLKNLIKTISQKIRKKVPKLKKQSPENNWLTKQGAKEGQDEREGKDHKN